MNTHDEILEYIAGLEIIDTHEHLPHCEAARSPGSDVLAEWLRHYFSCDLVSAGLSEADLERVRDPRGDLLERWELAEPYWHAAASTGYGRSLALAARDLYGIDRVDRDSIAELNRRFQEARGEGDHYRYVLKEKSRIRVSVLDSNLDADPQFFVSAVRFDGYLMPTHRRDLAAAGQRVGFPIHSLGDWQQALEVELDRAFERGAATLKCGLAYQRSLRFDKVTQAEAETSFHELFADPHSPPWRGAIKVGKPLQDYMMHHLLTLADRRGLTFQFHTGLQEGNGNVIYDANPVHLTNLFLEYGDVKFDIFHMGYPYMQELSNLAKNFRNVFIDMCWGHIISPTAARRALVEWLDAVPANKISAFGGDYCFVDGVYGHQYLARRNVAAALAEKVANGSFDLERAKEIAHWLFIDTPARLFGVE
jgi:hypothetical protein